MAWLKIRCIGRALTLFRAPAHIDLAKRANISTPPCLRRVRGLEDSGAYLGVLHLGLWLCRRRNL
jgi:hypothetical protein